MREFEESAAPFVRTAVTDVFISYSRADAAAALRLRERLKAAGLATFLDRDQLAAGQEWQPALERGIAGSAAVAVLVGKAGLGTWQQREVQLALDRAAELSRRGRGFPVIPVILPGVDDPPGGFLKLRTWVDLRADEGDPAQLDLLLKGIRGEPAAGAALREAICPYRGLLAFREEDAGLFFGREAEVAGLVDRIRRQPLLTLVGRSGSGKSSVIQAGLIPALRRGADGCRWAVVTLRPGDAPLHALVRAFDPPPADLAPLEATARTERQVELFREDSRLLAAHVRELLAAAEERGTDRLLLYVDQWEELYTQAVRTADADRFIDLLLHAAAASPCTVALSVRADFYGDLLRHDGLAAAVPAGLVNLGPLGREDLALAIEQPARAVGLAVDRPLTETLLSAVAEDSGKLPLLQYALKQTWQQSRRRDPPDARLSLDDYGNAGGIDGAIARTADEVYARLDGAAQAAARRLFVSLVTPGEGREDTRARFALPDDRATADIVRAFSAWDARLLVTGSQAVVGAAQPARLVEISHEALIREWQPLKDWVAANRETLRRRERVQDWLAAWEEGGRDPSLLLPPGLALEVGRKLLDDHGDVLIDEVEPYVRESIAADEARLRREVDATEAERQREITAAQRLVAEQRKRARIATALGLLALLVAGVAGWQWREAGRQAAIAATERDRAQVEQARAEYNLAAAARAANGLVFDLAQGLRNVARVPVATIRLVLTRADRLLADLAPGDDAPAELRRTRAAALNEFVTTYLDQGDATAAQAAAEQSRDIMEKLASGDPANMEWQRDLSVSWETLAEVRDAQGDLAGALDAYKQSQTIAARLAASDPTNAGWQSDLWIILSYIGDVLRS
ncbi:MAG: toll/interleukin-1 receptor domain-containing protein [Geminicoccaceae bacterium]